MIYLTPASVVYFCQVILTALVAVYLLWRSFQPVHNRLQLRLAAGVFAMTALLIALLWVEVSSLGPWRSYARFLNAPVLALHGIVIFLFIYHVPKWDPRERREVIAVVTFLVAGRLLFEIYVAVQRFQAFAAAGEASRSRPLLSELLLLVGVIWLIVVIIRRVRRLNQRTGLLLAEIALLSALPVFAVLVQVGFSLGWLTASVRQIALSLSAMIILPLFALLVFDMFADLLTLQARLVGVVLVVTFFLIGGVSWLLAPTYLYVAAGDYPPADAAVIRLSIDSRSLDQLVQTVVALDTYQELESPAVLVEGANAASAASERYLAARRVLHVPMLLLSLAAVFTTAWVIVAIPLLLRWSLFRPLNALLTGVRQVNAGRLDVAVPVHQHDELGQLAESFNRMVADLRDMVATLEARVAERTAELARSEARFRGLVEQIDEIIFRVALPEVRVEYVSPALERVLGYQAERVIADPLFLGEILHPDSVDWWDARLAELAQSKVAPQYEYQVIDSQGNPRWIQQSNVGITDGEGRLVVIECVARDVTANKLAEAQLRAQQSELAALQERERIGRDLHDSVNQSIHSLVYLAETLAAVLGRQQFDQAQTIAERLQESAHQALKETRLLLYQLRLPLVESGADLIRSLETRLAMVERYSGIQADIHLEGSLDDCPPEYTEQLFGIALEALNNALKHSQAHTLHIGLRCSPRQVELEVVDDGKGFDLAEVRAGGMGLGNLYRRAELIDGQLGILSAPGQGCRVHLRAEIKEPP